MLSTMAPSPAPSSAMCCQTVRQTVYGQSWPAMPAGADLFAFYNAQVVHG